MQRVAVGLSGGVDSAVSAALLSQAGYDVTGVFIKIWQPEFIECTWREDRLDAMRVAAALGIPFREIDLSDEYKTHVVDSMIADYRRGVTPNPDVLCNEKIKFGSFMRWARHEGADYVATGHYARVGEKQGSPQLMRGADRNKDQSYFLYRIAGDDLRHVMFPIGHLTKPEVRTEAARFGLPVADKHDSQGLCFVGDVTMRDFLRRFITVEEGVVEDVHGNPIGVHDGAALYTIGQRHGFAITRASGAAVQFVTKIDTTRNVITVSGSRNDAAASDVSLRDAHWIHEESRRSFDAQVQTRYRETPVDARVTLEGGVAHVRFHTPHLVSPGQSLVVYDGDYCLGGGIIA